MRRPHVMDMEGVDVVHELNQLIGRAGDVEARLLLYLARRWVLMGQGSYGPVKLDGSREWMRERMEESADMCFYTLCATFEARGSVKK